MLFKNLGTNYAFTCGRIDGREEKIYNATNYYYAGFYDQGFQLGKLELELVQNEIDRLNIEWDKARFSDKWMLANVLEGLRALAILHLQKIKKCEDL